MFQDTFKGLSRKFNKCFMEVLGKLQRCFKKGSRVFHLRLKGVLSSFKGVSRVFERSLKGVSGKFQWCFRKFR